MNGMIYTAHEMRARSIGAHKTILHDYRQHLMGAIQKAAGAGFHSTSLKLPWVATQGLIETSDLVAWLEGLGYRAEVSGDSIQVGWE